MKEMHGFEVHQFQFLDSSMCSFHTPDCTWLVHVLIFISSGTSKYHSSKQHIGLYVEHPHFLIVSLLRLPIYGGHIHVVSHLLQGLVNVPIKHRPTIGDISSPTATGKSGDVNFSTPNS